MESGGAQRWQGKSSSNTYKWIWKSRLLASRWMYRIATAPTKAICMSLKPDSLGALVELQRRMGSQSIGTTSLSTWRSRRSLSWRARGRDSRYGLVYRNFAATASSMLVSALTTLFRSNSVRKADAMAVAHKRAALREPRYTLGGIRTRKSRPARHASVASRPRLDSYFTPLNRPLISILPMFHA